MILIHSMHSVWLNFFLAAVIFYYYLNTAYISVFFFGWGGKVGVVFNIISVYASPHPFRQVNCRTISDSVFELQNLNKYKSPSPFRLLIADNFLALIIKHDQFWEITFLELQSILKCLFTMVKNYK